nr:protein of unknown function DUF2228 [Hymenolepis microstoma]
MVLNVLTLDGKDVIVGDKCVACIPAFRDIVANVLFHETGLRLVGPFEVLADKNSCSEYDCLADYYRYFHDPPEFVTVLTEDGEHPFHIGYFRERLEQKKKEKSNIYQKLMTFVKENRVTLVKGNSVKRKPTCKTLNEVGIEIKLRGDLGYRPVNATNNDLVASLDNATDAKMPNAARLDELMTFVQFANDEGDYGQGLELGLDLLAYHPSTKTPDESFKRASRLNARINCLLPIGYQLAGLPKFAEVVRKHMANRSRVKKLRKIDSS